MVYDRPSWREIDNKKDQAGRRKKSETRRTEIKEHSTRYAKYKADLDRLFDQGLAGELLKQTQTENNKEPDPEPALETKKQKIKKKKENSKAKTSRFPTNPNATNRLKLIRTIVTAENHQGLIEALDELIQNFGMPDDWEVLVRVVEHRDEQKILLAIQRMKQLLPVTKKIPRRFSLKERLRTIGQTAQNTELRNVAKELEGDL